MSEGWGASAWDTGATSSGRSPLGGPFSDSGAPEVRKARACRWQAHLPPRPRARLAVAQRPGPACSQRHAGATAARGAGSFARLLGAGPGGLCHQRGAGWWGGGAGRRVRGRAQRPPHSRSLHQGPPRTQVQALPSEARPPSKLTSPEFQPLDSLWPQVSLQPI